MFFLVKEKNILRGKTGRIHTNTVMISGDIWMVEFKVS